MTTQTNQPPTNLPRPRVLTVRMPPELYAAFKGLAHDRRQSMNALALQILNETTHGATLADAQEKKEL